MLNNPHRRFNQLTGEWVLVSPHRAKRPWLGQVEKLAPEQLPAYDPMCYLCPLGYYGFQPLTIYGSS